MYILKKLITYIEKYNYIEIPPNIERSQNFINFMFELSRRDIYGSRRQYWIKRYIENPKYVLTYFSIKLEKEN